MIVSVLVTVCVTAGPRGLPFADEPKMKPSSRFRLKNACGSIERVSRIRYCQIGVFRSRRLELLLRMNGWAPVTDYRIYHLMPNGTFGGVVEASFGSDEEAVQHALMVLNVFKEAEVWAGARFIARVPSAAMVEPRLDRCFSSAVTGQPWVESGIANGLST